MDHLKPKPDGCDAGQSCRPSVPIVEVVPGALDGQEQKRLSELAAKLLRNEPALNATGHFGSTVQSGLHCSGPALLLADQSEISLFGPPERALLEYRAAALADSGDMLVLSHGRSRDFETYLERYLGISGIEVLSATAGPAERHWPLPKRCLYQSGLFRRIAEKARAAGRLSIIPYLSTGHVWNLARRIGEETGAAIAVAGPPPRLTRRINDKVWFANRVKQVLGQEALSPAVSVYGPSALAGHVRRMSVASDRLVIKIPDSAGSTGNIAVETKLFRGQSPSWIRETLLDMLMATGWQGSFPLKIELWEAAILASPSVQIWVPCAGSGLPVIEGLYEQIVQGARGKFIGATKSRMPPATQVKMASQAMKLAFLLQELGYFGRCSMDAIVSGPDYERAVLHWVECNGRWGGVSLPMTLANRLLSDPAGSQCLIVQQLNLSLPPRPFQTAIEALGGVLFEQGKSDEGVVLLTPTGYEQGVGVHFMALAPSLGRVREVAEHALACLVGGSD